MLSKTNDVKSSFKTLAVGGVAIIILGFIVQMYFPWWSLAVVAFVVGFAVNESAPKSMLYGTLAATLLWSVYAAFLNTANNGLIGEAVAKMIGTNSTLLITYTGLLGGFVGGMFAMSGALLRKMM